MYDHCRKHQIPDGFIKSGDEESRRTFINMMYFALGATLNKQNRKQAND